MELSRAGNTGGIPHLRDAIEYRYQGKVISYYRPGLARYDGLYDDATERILRLAQEDALWKTPLYEVQRLLARAQVLGTEFRSIWLQAREMGCRHDQVRAIQLLGLHLACQVLLQKAKASQPTDTSPTAPSGEFSDMRLVMTLSKAARQRFKDYSPQMTAAVMLAMTEKNRDDLVERPEGIYLSRQCWDRISSYAVWLADNDEMIVTRRRLEGQPDEPKEDSQDYLAQHLPKSRKLGGVGSFEYALGLVMAFDLDRDRLLVKEDQSGVAIF
jgi:hypothetical protein